ncbi:MAG: glycoside hydrolase family 88 protein [Proteobacteria bacterium]|nr:glycoside hydrolase family 88 protein [Pseudomonadota bacterium]
MRVSLMQTWTTWLRRCALCAGALALAILSSTRATGAQSIDIGLATRGERIEALLVESASRKAPVVVLLGGLSGNDASSQAVRAAVARHELARHRGFTLLAVPVANPDSAALRFPPAGVAYRDNPESHVLWRWLGALAPDLVLIAGNDAGLAAALGAGKVADMGRIPARAWSGDLADLPVAKSILPSDARQELERRRARSPRELATQLAQRYGRSFDQPWYIEAIALIARSRLGELDDVQRLARPWVDGTKDPLARPNALIMAGHIVFTDLYRRSKDPSYLAAVRRVADLGFDARGQMLEAMPFHGEYSDSVFMGTVIAAQAGALTGERRYFDMADRHLRFMERLDRRPDGLYRHQPAADAAWGRGNGFAALGLALTLSELPRDTAAYRHALESYRALMDALLPHQNRDGLWRNVIDHPGAYPEFTATAMIGFALQRGLDQGWIRGRAYRRAVAQAWTAVNSRTSTTGTFIDVCESTTRMTSLDQYLKRAAILGDDPRGGAMALLFATELMEK